MSWQLELKSLDEEDKTKTFPSREEAIDYAVVWFVSAYDPEENETLRGVIPLGITNDTLRLISTLEQGEEFMCGRFFERAILKQT